MSDPATAAEQALAQGRVAEAVALAREGAVAGHAGACALLASWHLAGTPVERNLAEARRLLARARVAGDEWATLTEIPLTASGAGAPPDWAGAVALLRAAAPRFALAAEDLALLQSMALDADGDPLAEPASQVIATAPRIVRLPGFLTPAECVHIAAMAQAVMAPSMVADPATGKLIAHPIRTSSAGVLGPTRESLPIQAIQRRIARACAIPVSHGEPLVVLHYAPGQQYRMHLDTLPGEANQRVATVLLYLNDGYTGGETVFESGGHRIAARQGDALLFANVDAHGAPDPRARHAGLPVTSGVKWLATRWIRAAPLDIWGAG